MNGAGGRPPPPAAGRDAEAGEPPDGVATPRGDFADEVFSDGDIARRLRLYPGLAPHTPPELWDGLPVEWARTPASLEDVQAVWARRAEGVARGELPGALQAYAHVPFCRTRCGFCQFATVTGIEESRAARWLEQVEAEAAALAPVLGRPEAQSVSVGGGTPSALGAAHLARLLAALDRIVSRAPGAYYSVELNPDSTTEEKLAALAYGGVTRVSFGVQSLHAATLEAVARGYQREAMVEAAVAGAKERGFLQVAVDLMASLPEETPESFERGLRRVLALGPDQLVVYEYQPVVRGHRTMPQGALSFREAAVIARRVAAESGHDVLPHTGVSLVLARPGGHVFASQYMQHPRTPVSTVGLGVYAQSHAFGVAHYRREEPSGEGSADAAYSLSRSSPAMERSRVVGRRLGAGLALDRAALKAELGRGALRGISPRMRWFERQGLVRATDSGWEPSEQIRHRPEAPFVLMDRDTVEAIARRALPVVDSAWLAERLPEWGDEIAQSATEAPVVRARLLLAPGATSDAPPSPARSAELTFAAPLEPRREEARRLVDLAGRGLVQPSAALQRLGELVELSVLDQLTLVRSWGQRSGLAAFASPVGDPKACADALLHALDARPARLDMVRASARASRVGVVQRGSEAEILVELWPSAGGRLLGRVLASLADGGADAWFDGARVRCLFSLVSGQATVSLIPRDGAAGDRLRRGLRDRVPRSPVWVDEELHGAELDEARFPLVNGSPRLDGLCIYLRERRGRRLPIARP